MADRTVAVHLDTERVLAEVKAYVDERVAAEVTDLRTRLRRQRDASTDLRARLKATSDALNEARNEAVKLRRQVADLAEERDLLVHQLVAIRTMAKEPFDIGLLRRILDGKQP